MATESLDYVGTVGPSPGTNFMTRVHGTKRDDSVSARAGLTGQQEQRAYNVGRNGSYGQRIARER